MSTHAVIVRTPLVAIEGVWVKLECCNPSGSIKDRIARYMLEAARARGELAPGDTVVECTSGNTGIALAMVAQELGYRLIVYMPEHMSVERRRMLERLGADVLLTDKALGFAGAIALRDRHRGEPRTFVADQFANPDNARCHQETTGVELVEQLRVRGSRRLDAFVAGVGTGGTLMGVSRALRKAHPDVLRVAVEPEESAIMSGGSAGDHGIMGIGDGFIPALVERSEIDRVIRVSTDEAHEAAVRIRRDHGFCVGRSSGANLVAALRLKAEGMIVATVWPDSADRYLSVGLEASWSDESLCPVRHLCAARSHHLLSPRPN
jgi:cysteine synthase A